MLIGLLAPIAGALVNIVTIVVLAFPSPFQSYKTLGLSSYFPGLLIPGFLAPLATYLHILSIKQLLYLKKEQAAGAAPVYALG